MKKIALTLVATGALLFGTAPVANAYPPVVVPVTQGGDTNGGSDAGGGTLPSTGSDSTSTALLVGFGSLLMGVGLFGTARVRRNQVSAVG